MATCVSGCRVCTGCRAACSRTLHGTVHCVRLYPHTVQDTHSSQVTISNHNTDNVLYGLYVSTFNQVCNFSYVLIMAPWWWFPRKSKHVGAILLILKCFNNSTFFNVVCISWILGWWVSTVRSKLLCGGTVVRVFMFLIFLGINSCYFQYPSQFMHIRVCDGQKLLKVKNWDNII